MTAAFTNHPTIPHNTMSTTEVVNKTIHQATLKEINAISHHASIILTL
jgi:hypothetical protein